MAVDLHNPESLLPTSLFRSEDESEVAIKPIRPASATTDIWELSCGSVSSGSSESEETGDEDYMAELSLHMSQYMFHEDDKLAVPGISVDRQQKTWGLPTSPQSTLWSPMGSTHWGQNGSSREPSPPVTETREKQSLVSGEAQPVKNSDQSLTDYQLRAIQFYKLKQQQVARKKQLQGKSNKACQQSKERAKSRPLPNPWSNSNSGATQQSGSGMRAVFLSGSGSRSGSCGGTGVFLPRVDRTNNPSESRKKLGCSSVLIPARVAEALKLHFDHVGLVARHNSVANYGPPLQQQHDTGKNQKSKSATSHQYEVALPQEWTY